MHWPAIKVSSKIHYAWVVLATTFIALLVTAAVRSEPGIILKSLEHEFGWSRQSISLAVSVNLLLFGLAGPFLGRLMDLYGPRRVVITTAFIIFAGVSATLLIQQSWHLLLFWGVIVGSGSAGMSMVLASSVINRWFYSRRGLALGIVGAAMSAGQLMFTPVLMQLNMEMGWRASIIFIVMLLGIVVLPALWLFMRNKPEDHDLLPYGATKTRAVGSKASPMVMSKVIKKSQFWLLAISFAICGLTTSGLFQTHLIPHGTENGFSK